MITRIKIQLLLIKLMKNIDKKISILISKLRGKLKLSKKYINNIIPHI